MSSPPLMDDADSTPGFLGRLRSISPLQREVLIYTAALLVGVLLMPLLIWFVGNRLLGPYTHGQNQHAGPGALLQDFLSALAHGSVVFWGVALAPALVLLLVRLFIRALWGGRRDRGA